MTTQTAVEERVLCPSCRKKGRRVSPVTVRALLKAEFAETIAVSERSCSEANGNGESGCHAISEDTGWRFCDSYDCDVVYFSENDGSAFTKSQLRVAVGVKERTGERPLCYCFGHSVDTIKEELSAKGRSDAREDIRRKMKDPGCHCETENPSGSCCLGSVAKGIQIAQEELKMTTSNLVPPGVSKSTSTSPSGRGEKLAKVGTLVSAVMSSSCCWLPLLLLAVGVSGAGIAATLEAYRPIFIAVTFGFLAAAFYFTYRPRRAGADGEQGCCASESSETATCCKTSGKRPFSRVAFNKVMLWVVTVVAIAFLLFPNYVGILLGTHNGVAITPEMKQAVLKIEGMTCEGCAATVAKAIRSVPGVLAVDVDYETGKALVGVEPDHPIPEDEILSALKNAGYGGTLVDAEHQ